MYFFQITVQRAEIFEHARMFSLRYQLLGDIIAVPKSERTLNPVFSHSKVFSIPLITSDHVTSFTAGCVTFVLYEIQEQRPPDQRLLQMTTMVSKLYCYITCIILHLHVVWFSFFPQ